jgi:hypothetical protein
MIERLRTLLLALFLLLPTACTASLNAGDDGGIAFIGFAIMLIVGVAVLWFIMGRED